MRGGSTKGRRVAQPPREQRNLTRGDWKTELFDAAPGGGARQTQDIKLRNTGLDQIWKEIAGHGFCLNSLGPL